MLNKIKKILMFLFVIFTSVNITYADTISMTWLNEDGTTYDTTTCNAGGDVILPNTPSKRGYTFVGWEKISYVPIEYLESTGTQYIDTGVVGNLNTEYEITVKSNRLPETSTDHSLYAIFGSRTSAYQNTIMSVYHITNEEYGIINDFGNYQITRQSPIRNSAEMLHKYTLKNSKSERTITDNNTGWTDTVTTTYSGSLTTPTNLYIGYAGSLSGLLNVANLYGNIYRCKIWDNGTLVRDFIPVLDYNDVPCMYDKVSNQYFYNAGTGDFIAGPVISEQ
jgi:hypothetical protein